MPNGRLVQSSPDHPFKLSTVNGEEVRDDDFKNLMEFICLGCKCCLLSANKRAELLLSGTLWPILTMPVSPYFTLLRFST